MVDVHVGAHLSVNFVYTEEKIKKARNNRHHARLHDHHRPHPHLQYQSDDYGEDAVDEWRCGKDLTFHYSLKSVYLKGAQEFFGRL